MAVSFRPFATAGVAVAAASVLTIVPSAPPALLATPTAEAAAVTREYQLTSSVDPVVAWAELFNTTQINWAAILNEWTEAPFPVVQQLVVNWVRYFAELPNLGVIFDQIIERGTAAFNALFAYNEDNLQGHDLVYLGLSEALPELQPLLDYTTTFSSGILWGAIGTALSPWLEFGDSINDIVNYLFVEPDLEKAWNTFLNIPADWLDGFFNGYDGLVSLDFLIPLLPALPAGATITELGLKMGGLFSPAGGLLGATDIIVEVPTSPITPPLRIPIPGQLVGPLASFIAQGKVQAEAFGWSGTGNPIAELIPGGEEAEAPAEEAEGEGEAPVEEAEGEAPVALAEGDETVVEDAALDETVVEEVDETEVDETEVDEVGETGDGETGDGDSPADAA